MTKRTAATDKPVRLRRRGAAFAFDPQTVATRLANSPPGTLIEVPILPPSPIVGRDGRGPLRWSIETLVAAFQRGGVDLPLCIDHKLDAPAGGWVKGLGTNAAGRAVAYVEFLPDADWLVQSRRYLYISPGYFVELDDRTEPDGAGEVVSVFEVSLVNAPAFILPALACEGGAGDGIDTDTTETVNSDAADAGAADETDNTDNTDNTDTADTEDAQMLEQLRAALGLPADADAAACFAAITALQSTASRATAIATAAGAAGDAAPDAVVVAARAGYVPAADLTAATAAIAAAEAATAAAAARATAAEAALSEHRAAAELAALTAEVDAAISANKALPAQRDALLAVARADATAFRALLAAAPAHALTATLVAGQLPGGDETHGLTQAQLAECSRLGIKPATFAQQLAKQAAQ